MSTGPLPDVAPFLRKCPQPILGSRVSPSLVSPSGFCRVGKEGQYAISNAEVQRGGAPGHLSPLTWSLSLVALLCSNSHYNLTTSSP